MNGVEVKCTQHGLMVRDQAAHLWRCTGFSGEGCLTAILVTDAEVWRALYRGVCPPGTEVFYRERPGESTG